MGDALNNIQQLAAMFKALGDPARLRIFSLLCFEGRYPIEDAEEVKSEYGITVGDVCARITGEERVSSTISQQLKQLRHAGLITMQRRGKNMFCNVNHDALAMLALYITECKRGSMDDFWNNQPVETQSA